MPAETVVERKKRARVITNRLRKAYPDAGTALHHSSPLELLLATILSAQCTDERVNKVTPSLFARYPTAADFAEADRDELEELVRSTGFYRNKAKSIQGASRKIVEEFGGEVPQTMEKLLKLPGVARKTANVVLGNYFGIASGVVVDTHVFRLAHRMGFSASKNTGQVEKDLMRLVPEKDWVDLGNLFIRHGRTVCSARRPECESCTVKSLCPKVDVARALEKENPTESRPRVPLGERIRATRKIKKKSK
jgi:endonuclease-3